MVAIEERMAPRGAVVKSPDRLRDLDTKRLREVDASIRYSVGSAEILVTVECRKRSGPADVTWIEQLATKRNKIGAAKTIAVSSSGFTNSARQSAERYGIELRILGEIVPEDIDALFAPQSLVHMYRSIDSLRCKVVLTSGSLEELDGMDARFRHPLVHGHFPGAIFLRFIEMKDPEVLWRVAVDGTASKVEFVLNGEDPNLIPIPLGERKKDGHLELVVNNEYCRVQTVTLEALVSYNSEVLRPQDGRHYAYAAPEAPPFTLSHFDSAMFGMPVRIEHFTNSDSVPSATVSFPSGVKLPSNVLLHGLPVTIKVRGSGLADGIFFRPLASFFENEAEIVDFNTNNFMFLLKEDIDKLKSSASDNPDGKVFWELVKILPRAAVEYIDLTAAIFATAKRGR